MLLLNNETQLSMKRYPSFFSICSLFYLYGDGGMLDLPQRGSMWRFGFNV
jgi:hypothetical protein